MRTIRIGKGGGGRVRKENVTDKKWVEDDNDNDEDNEDDETREGGGVSGGEVRRGERPGILQLHGRGARSHSPFWLSVATAVRLWGRVAPVLLFLLLLPTLAPVPINILLPERELKFTETRAEEKKKKSSCKISNI